MRMLLLPFLLSLAPQESTPAPPAQEVLEAYVEANFQRRDDAASGELWAKDAFFVDRTGEPFGGPLATGVQGRDAILKLQASWGIAASGFEHPVAFTCGEYGVYAGRMWVEYKSGGRVENLPFATVLQARDGALVRREDHGDYRQLVRAKVVEPELEDLSRAYLEAYLARDFEELGGLAAASISFQDPTAVRIGAGQEVRSRAKVVQHLEQAFQGSLSFEFDRQVEFFFHRTAVFAGTCRFAFPGKALGLPVDKAAFEMPLMVVLQVRDGRVTEHRDFADYDLYAKQLQGHQKAAEDG